LSYPGQHSFAISLIPPDMVDCKILFHLPLRAFHRTLKSSQYLIPSFYNFPETPAFSDFFPTFYVLTSVSLALLSQALLPFLLIPPPSPSNRGQATPFLASTPYTLRDCFARSNPLPSATYPRMAVTGIAFIFPQPGTMKTTANVFPPFDGVLTFLS